MYIFNTVTCNGHCIYTIQFNKGKILHQYINKTGIIKTVVMNGLNG